MITFSINKNKRIEDILSVIKLTSILFSGVITIKVFFGYIQPIYNIYDFNIKFWSYLNLILAISLFYIIWTFQLSRKLSPKAKTIADFIETTILLILFIVLINITGKHLSEYKLIFIFPIITTTIQFGLKYGVIISSISSIYLLNLDLRAVNYQNINKFFENDLITTSIFLLTAWALGYYVKLEKAHIALLENKSHIDELTGLYNHGYFYEELHRVFSNKDKQKYNTISLLLIDIDSFRHYNELYGHQEGDEILSNIGSMLKELLPNYVVARYGGDEFAAILLNKNENEAYEIAETVRKAMMEKKFEGEENLPSKKLTFSIGIASTGKMAKNEKELVKCADDALYRAKFFNKNRVEIYSSVLDMIKGDIEEEHIDLITSIKTLINVINANDKYTYAHTERVVIYSRLFAAKKNFDLTDEKKLVYGAYMHDIGKVGISAQILNKKMPLTNEEWEIIKDHPVIGANIISPVESLQDLIPLIRHHHERYDGTGYPDGLKGKEIPYLARVLTVIDSFDAMTSARPYGTLRTFEEAITELQNCSGTQFDPEIVDEFSDIIANLSHSIQTYMNRKNKV